MLYCTSNSISKKDTFPGDFCHIYASDISSTAIEGARLCLDTDSGDFDWTEFENFDMYHCPFCTRRIFVKPRDSYIAMAGSLSCSTNNDNSRPGKESSCVPQAMALGVSTASLKRFLWLGVRDDVERDLSFTKRVAEVINLDPIPRLLYSGDVIMLAIVGIGWSDADADADASPSSCTSGTGNITTSQKPTTSPVAVFSAVIILWYNQSIVDGAHAKLCFCHIWLSLDKRAAFSTLRRNGSCDHITCS
mmetsp:Transcript_17009/g.41230  ORF Transcript_17009/g.41230 Transcript_17009/m.41230 type:complete len:248 (+) Transcript_17009:55-798(+)